MKTPSSTPPGNRRATIIDVARLAGVSQGSVSRVLTGKNWVSADLRAQVEEAAKALGYVPNVMAQGLKSQRSRTIAALVSDMSNPLHGEFLLAAEASLRAAGHLLLVANTHDRPELEQELLATFRPGRIDGLIVAHADERNKGTLDALRRTGVPIVFHDREGGGLGDSVMVDHAAGAYAATNHLLELGHRRIALLSPPGTIWPGHARLVGYRRALKEAGVTDDARLRRALSSSGEQSLAQTQELIELDGPPTAIICLGTRMLAGVLTALSLAGLRLPTDMSIVGVGETDLVRLHDPAITALRWNIAECGRQAAQMLLERLATSEPAMSTPRAVRMPVELIVRQSSAGPTKRRSKKT